MAFTLVNKSKYATAELLAKTASEVFSLLGQDFEANLKFVSADEIQKLNKQYRGLDVSTNVLSFNAEDAEGGDIVIAESVVQSEAQKLGVEPTSLDLLYLVHGMLHLAGHDHQTESERAKMEELEAKILDKIGLSVEN